MRRVLLFVSYYNCWFGLVGVCLCCLGWVVCVVVGFGWLVVYGWWVIVWVVDCLVLCFAFGFVWCLGVFVCCL